MQVSGKISLGLLFVGIGLALLYESYVAEVSPFLVPGEMGTMLYPRIILYMWLALSALYLLSHDMPYNAQELRDSLPGISRVVASIAVYIFSLNIIGLLLSTFIFLLLFFYVMEYRQLSRALPVALLGAVVTWLVFSKILSVILPQPFWVYLF